MVDYYLKSAAKLRRAGDRPGFWDVLVWADDQPVDAAQIAISRGIKANVKARYPTLNQVISAGDLVHRGAYEYVVASNDRYEYADWINDRNATFPTVHPEDFVECSGNHDRNYADHVSGPLNSFAHYLKYFSRMNYYTVRGNVVTIVMGSVNPDTAGSIHPTTVKWAKKIIQRHRQHVIIIVTHHCAPSCGLHRSSERDWNGGPNAADLYSFINEVGNEVDLWISGHVGANLKDPAVVGHIYANKCWHVNVGMHIPTHVANPDRITYCKMRLQRGSKFIRFERIDATTGAALADKSFTIKARYPVELTGRLLYDGRRSFDELGGLLESRVDIVAPTNYTYTAPGGVPTWTVDTGKDTFLGIYSFDPGRSLSAGCGPGIGIFIPGGTNTDPSGASQDQPYGYGAYLSAERAVSEDADFSTNLKVYSSGAGRGIDSLVLAYTLTPAGYVNVANRLGLNTDTPIARIDINDSGVVNAGIAIRGTNYDLIVPVAQNLNVASWTTGSNFTHRSFLYTAS